jgi:uncharacterized oligopeptide transporter (OPT) family protein
MFMDRFPPSEVAARIAASLGIGLLVGIERERSNKDLGIRTFALTALLGTIAALFGPPMAVVSSVGVSLIVIFANARSLLVNRSLETTTSAALPGKGHLLTPVASAILMTMLLAWKVELAPVRRRLGTRRDSERGAVRAIGTCGLSHSARPFHR